MQRGVIFNHVEKRMLGGPENNRVWVSIESAEPRARMVLERRDNQSALYIGSHAIELAESFDDVLARLDLTVVDSAVQPTT